MNELALFAGAGGGIYGGQLLGWRCVCAVEIDPYARACLAARQNDKIFEPFPIWDDVCSFDGRPWRGVVDVISGGFPCEDISVAGKGAGLEHGKKSRLWCEYARIIREVEPRFVFVENSPALVFRGLDIVLGDLASLGYDAAWGVFSAADVGAPHERERLWIRAERSSDADGKWELQPQRIEQNERGRPRNVGKEISDADDNGHRFKVQSIDAQFASPADAWGDWWSSERGLGRVADGVADWGNRIRCLGNGQVPAVAAFAWRALSGS